MGSKLRCELPCSASVFALFVSGPPLVIDDSVCGPTRNEDGDWRRDFVYLGKILLIDRDADPTSRIDIKQRLSDGDRRKRLNEWKRKLFPIDFETYDIAELVSKLLKVVSPDIGDQAAEWIVETDHFALDSVRFDLRFARLQADEFIHNGSSKRPVFARCEMCSGGRKNIATVKCRGDFIADNL